MRTPDPLLPPLDPVVLDYCALFRQLPHPIMVLSPGLQILEINAAGCRFLDKPASELIGVPLFDILPRAAAGSGGWQDRLRASYDDVRLSREPVTLLLSARTSAVATGHKHGATVASSASTGPAAGPIAGSGMWHICHGPIVDQAGELIGIATHALALCGIEAAIAQVGGFATTELFTINRSLGSVIDAPIVAASAPLAPATPDALPHAATGDGEPLPKSSHAMSILMVEDNQDLRSSTAELLQFLGHRVVSVPDAELALRQLESGAFDILFTDLTLPKMSGAELARHVLQHHRPTRVIITSGYGRAMANAQNLDAVFLPKPYRVADLEEVLGKLQVVRA